MGTILALHALALCVTFVSAVTDTRSGRIPNWLTLPLIPIALLTHSYATGWSGLTQSLLGLVACALVPLLLFSRAAMGGGDVKLLAALGSVLGPSLGIEVQLGAFLVMTFFVMAKMCWNGQLWLLFKNAWVAGCNLVLPARFRRELDPATLTEVRMGVSIFTATALSMFVAHMPRGWL